MWYRRQDTAAAAASRAKKTKHWKVGFQHTNTQNCIHQRSCSLIIAHSIHSKDKHMQCPHTHIKWPTQTCCAIAVVPLLPQSRAILQQLVEQNSRHVGFPLTCSALVLRKATPCLLARFGDLERPEHTPWSPAWTHTCTVVYRRLFYHVLGYDIGIIWQYGSCGIFSEFNHTWYVFASHWWARL